MVHLITGKAGKPHIDGSCLGSIHQADRGIGNWILEWGDQLKATVQSANSIQIGTGCGSMEGRDFLIAQAETVTIDNGSQNMRRNDLICAHYHRDMSTGVESMTLDVLKGTPATSGQKDPSIPSGTIVDGNEDAYWALWRVPLDGIDVGTPVRLFTVLPSVSSVRDSVSDVADDVASVRGLLPDVKVTDIAINSGKYGKAQFWVTHGIRHLMVNWGSVASGSYGKGNIGTLPGGTKYAPSVDLEFPAIGSDSQWMSMRSVGVHTDGTVTYQCHGGSQTMKQLRVACVW